MKALVTGSTGFVGAAVTRCLLERGLDVRVLVRRDSDLRNLEGLKVEQAYGDLRDVASLRQALAGCRHLYHVAAHYALWAPDPQIFYDINVTGTRNLMEAARDSGVERIVYTSTIGAIGLPPGGGAGSEETPVSLEQMVGHYKRSKFLAEQEVRKLARAGLPGVIVNPSAPVGARDIKPSPTGLRASRWRASRWPSTSCIMTAPRPSGSWASRRCPWRSRWRRRSAGSEITATPKWNSCGSSARPSCSARTSFSFWPSPLQLPFG